jgi:HlyD family secretion protein
VSVNENDIVRVHIGDTALIEVDAYLNRKFKGIVTEVATSANTQGTSVDQVTNFDVKIRVLRESYTDLLKADQPGYSPLRPGMSATVDIQTETVRNILTLPIQAVTTRKDTSSIDKKEVAEDKKVVADEKQDDAKKKEAEEMVEYVFLYVDGTAKLIKVKSGIQDNTYIVISEGLKEGDEVISAPYKAVSKTLKNNQKVKKVDKKELFTED